MLQVIVTEIRKRGRIPNLVIKLDIMKAYDRVEWFYLMKVLKRIGFGERLIDMVFRLISNNWYTIIINGQPKGFFKSSRGLKQGDPLSPTLLILEIEIMLRALIVFCKKENFDFWHAHDRPKLNHIAFANDMIILCKIEVKTMQLVNETLNRYEYVSGKKVNKAKKLYIYIIVCYRGKQLWLK